MTTCFFDIDGTLAENERIVPGILDALSTLRQRGHLVFICTGRPYLYADAMFHEVSDGYVASNGRYLFYHGTCLYEVPLSDTDVISYAQTARKHDCLLLFQGLHQRYITKQDALYFDLHGVVDDIPVNIWNHEQVYNFNVMYEKEEKFQQLKTLWNNQIVLNDHHNHRSADASIQTFDKGAGIRKIISLLELDSQTTYGFGDGENDIAMFQACTYRIAMGNAMPTLKKQATYISSHFQKHGVLQALQHFHLL